MYPLNHLMQDAHIWIFVVVLFVLRQSYIARAGQNSQRSACLVRLLMARIRDKDPHRQLSFVLRLLCCVMGLKAEVPQLAISCAW